MSDGALSFDVTVCICTRNRAVDVTRAIRSVQCSTRRAWQIVVSDDSTDDVTKQALKTFGRDIEFLEGPRRGLCANRNNALRSVTGTHVLFIDDDVVLSPYFLDEIAGALVSLEESSRAHVIVTGLERNNGRVVYPRDQVFWGSQSRHYRLEDRLRTVVINATVFPATLFDEITFDENLIYGYDEVDVTSQAIGRGYQLVLCPQAINDHYPAATNRDYYAPFVDASRLYVTFKRYWFVEHRRFKALCFAILAPLHLFASKARRDPKTAFPKVFKSTRLALSYLQRLQKRKRSPATR